MQLFLSFVVLGCFALASAATFKEEDGVIVLDDTNFAEALVKYDPILVEFYAPWYVLALAFLY